MCWHTEQIAMTQPFKAEEDIKVFKLCRGTSYDGDKEAGFVNIYDKTVIIKGREFMVAEKFVYEFETYHHDKRLKVLTIGDYIHQIDEGYHSYGVGKFTLERRQDRVRDNVIIRHVDKETKLYKDVDTLDIARFYVKLVLCTIPKGATYYKNEYDTYVSDTIKIDSIKEIFEFLTEEE